MDTRTPRAPVAVMALCVALFLILWAHGHIYPDTRQAPAPVLTVPA